MVTLSKLLFLNVDSQKFYNNSIVFYHFISIKYIGIIQANNINILNNLIKKVDHIKALNTFSIY